MFKEFLGLFHCCKKRKSSEEKNDSKDATPNQSPKKRNSKCSRKNMSMEEIMEKIDIGENVDNVECQHLLSSERHE
jgi:hypothetical protein